MSENYLFGELTQTFVGPKSEQALIALQSGQHYAKVRKFKHEGEEPSLQLSICVLGNWYQCPLHKMTGQVETAIKGGSYIDTHDGWLRLQKVEPKKATNGQTAAPKTDTNPPTATAGQDDEVF